MRDVEHIGRVEEIKGPHLAIDVPRRAGAPLCNAGNLAPKHCAWFEVHVAPHIHDRTVRYVGAVDDAAKSADRALPVPILWEEPFGIAMAETVASGTPVLGPDHGAVSEVVEEGVTGFVRNGAHGLVEGVGRLGEIHRAACRARMEAHYSDRAEIGAYLALYRELSNLRAGARSRIPA